jgi:hypothetical protein
MGLNDLKKKVKIMNSKELYENLVHLRNRLSIEPDDGYDIFEEDALLIDWVLDLLEDIDAVPQFKEQVNNFLENRLEE